MQCCLNTLLAGLLNWICSTHECAACKPTLANHKLPTILLTLLLCMYYRINTNLWVLPSLLKISQIALQPCGREKAFIQACWPMWFIGACRNSLLACQIAVHCHSLVCVCVFVCISTVVYKMLHSWCGHVCRAICLFAQVVEQLWEAFLYGSLYSSQGYDLIIDKDKKWLEIRIKHKKTLEKLKTKKKKAKKKFRGKEVGCQVETKNYIACSFLF